jgi:hypothetical protein
MRSILVAMMKSFSCSPFEPKNALVKQYHRPFKMENIDLSFAEEALGAIARKAIERKTGARGLRSIMESISKTLTSRRSSASWSDLLGLQRDRRVAPTEADIRMMAFSFREFTNLLNKGKRLAEIAKPKAPLDAVSFIGQLPVRGLRMKELSLLPREWRYSSTTGSTGFAGKSFGHIACLGSNTNIVRAPSVSITRAGI